MKLSRTWWVWAGLVVCAATVLAAMTWQTTGALAAERDRIAAEERADLQERMRLALWRMDSLGAAFMVRENQGGTPTDGEELPVKGRFRWLMDGTLVPVSGTAPRQTLRDFQEALRKVKTGTIDWGGVPEPEPAPPSPPPTWSDRSQKAANFKELQSRSKALGNAISQVPSLGADDRVMNLGGGAYRPAWIAGELYLLREQGSEEIRGVWVDSGLLLGQLLDEVRDLLPHARLVPAKALSDDGLVLASFPLRLEPGSLDVYRGSFSGAILLSLAAGWIAALVAVAAAGLLVIGVMRLSERRASFVSAVTHELRTPLTTFRLYSDMLESGAVREEKRGDYLRVLSREADRLSHLVENVLAFSRIERGSARSAVRTVRIADLLEPMRERLESRLATAEMELRMDLAGEAAGWTVRVDGAAVEHILFNLIDNAAKYACSGSPSRVEITLAGGGPGFAAIRVADHGPGISAAERKRIFRAFHKSARDAAESRPGVGLGLALSRRLARAVGGNLDCAAASGAGACFVLTVPRPAER